MTTILNWATSTQGLSSPQNMATDGTYLYVANSFYNNGKGVIGRINLSNTSDYTAVFANPNSNDYSAIFSVVVYGGFLYTANTVTISKYVLSTGAVVSYNWVTLPELDGGKIFSMDTDGTYLYVFWNGKIARYNLADPTQRQLTWYTGIPGGVYAVLSIRIYGDSLYTGNATDVVRIPLSDPSNVSIAIPGLKVKRGMATDGIHMYITNDDVNTVSQGMFDGQTVVPNFTTGLSGPQSAIIIGNYLYVSNGSNNTISRIVLPTRFPCFKEGSTILTDKGYVPVETLRAGDRVRTVCNGYVPIYDIGQKEIIHKTETSENPEYQLYECSPERYPELTEPLVLTGHHSVLVEEFGEGEREHTERIMGGYVYLTDGLYRLPVCADRRATIYPKPGKYRIYHLALENDDYYMNYGVYANGLLVETCSKRFLTELSGMELIGGNP